MGDVVYYFSPRVVRDADNRISRKLALLWTGPYRVVGKPSESLATLQPIGHWARGDRELKTTVDKLRVVRGPVPEDRLAPQVQVNLDELEEDLGGGSRRTADPRGAQGGCRGSRRADWGAQRGSTRGGRRGPRDPQCRAAQERRRDR